MKTLLVLFLATNCLLWLPRAEAQNNHTSPEAPAVEPVSLPEPSLSDPALPEPPDAPPVDQTAQQEPLHGPQLPPDKFQNATPPAAVTPPVAEPAPVARPKPVANPNSTQPSPASPTSPATPKLVPNPAPRPNPPPPPSAVNLTTPAPLTPRGDATDPAALNPLHPANPVEPPNADVAPVPVPSNTVGPAPGNAPTQDLAAEDGGYRISEASLNDIFQFLAKQAGRQYFHNMKIAGPEYRVTGHLNDGNPLEQMEELAFMYGLTLYTKGNTIYALNQTQLSQLPAAEFHYQLKYLRPKDMDVIKGLLQPILTPGSGIVNFEPKTSTIVIIDSAHRIEQAQSLLQNIDKAQSQIVVETKILRINSGAAERVGVDWSSSLGETGVSVEAARSLNSVFGLNSLWKTAIGTTAGDSLTTVETPAATNNVVLSPVQLNGVLRALASGGLATQISNPTLITEDNEKATISILDRVPIITTTVNQTEASNNVTEEVRYKIDQEDPSISKEPDAHREIGISMVVTPTVLPDGTVRMNLRPRTAQIVDQIKGQSGNYYPRVSESMIESIARVPDGHSLVVGGFYGEVKTKDKNKVPFLGDIPLINFFFKSRETEQERSSLVFIVTPTSYNPAVASSNRRQSERVASASSLGPHHDWVDDANPGPAHEPNMCRTIRGMKPAPAPYYAPPRGGHPAPAPAPAPSNSKPRFSKARR